ncbi:MAG: PilZ domain-containing protein [Clostridium sp.]
MKATERLKTNERVEFSIDNEIYKSTVQDIISNKSIAISIPVLGSKSYLPIIGEKIDFFILIGSDFHKYKGIVSNRIVDGNLRLIIVDDLSTEGKVQRREYFRIPVSLDIEYLPISNEIAENGVSKKVLDLLSDRFITAKSIDLSAGGIKIFTAEKVEEGTHVIVKVAISSSDTISIISKVVRMEKDPGTKTYKLGCRFLALDKNDTEKIVKFIFEKSRELMKR